MAKQNPSARQINAAKAVVENKLSAHPVSTRQILENAGYGSSLQNSPQRVLASTGFKQALNDLGLTEELITSSLVDDIEAKPEKRLGELKLGAEMLGMVRNEEKPPSDSKNTYNFIFSDEVQSRVKDINDNIKKLLTQQHVQENKEDTQEGHTS